jgi:hypothetical protein
MVLHWRLKGKEAHPTQSNLKWLQHEKGNSCRDWGVEAKNMGVDWAED